MPKKGPKKSLNTACWKPTPAEIHQAKKALQFGETYGIGPTKLEKILQATLEKELLGVEIKNLKYPKLKEEIEKLAENVKGISAQNKVIDEIFYNSSKESIAEAIEKQHIKALENH